MRKIFFILLLSLLIADSEKATITIYKDGTALIKQPVFWKSMSKGSNYIVYKELPNGIHQDTPFLNLANTQILSQRFNSKVFSSIDYFVEREGSYVNLKPKAERVITGQLLEISGGTVTIQHKGGVRTFKNENIEYLETKDKIKNPILKPFLAWDIKTERPGGVKGELVYKSANFSWNTVYRLVMNGQSSGELIAEAVISNSSDLDFKNTQVQLVEGNLNKPKMIRSRSDYAMKMTARTESQPAMEQSELGDYHIYTMKSKHDLQAKENITVRMYGPLTVGYVKTYVFENSERRQKEEPLKVELAIKNTESNGLGIPLPAGKVEMYTNSSTGGLEYIGADRIGQVPKGQSSTLLSGYAFDIIGKRTVLNYDRQRKSEEAVIEVQVTNSRTEPVQVRIVEHINGDWVVKNESHNYQKKDASTIHFSIILDPGKTKYVTYTYRKEWK
jgi:hypothetical protein